MKGYRRLRKKLLEKLDDLPDYLTYHGLHHTKDVYRVCNGYIRRLGLNGRERRLLRIAALAHDIGFVVDFREHERIGAEMTAGFMRDLDFSEEDIQVVRSMIISTKPENPSETKLEKILCDADLDYLGRDDFEKISNSLYKELTYLDLIDSYDEWMQLQVNFLEKHEYQTSYAQKYRAPKKKYWLNKIRETVKHQYSSE